MTAPSGFKDHFSVQSDAYQKYRPDYPPELFAWLAQEAPGRGLAIDVATGNGQAAVALARHFESVIATEPSAAQLRQARPDPRVEYRLEAAETISVPRASADLLVVAQAAHWFDWPQFCVEAVRVLRPGGVLAIWSYGDAGIADSIDPLIKSFSRDVVGPYWPRERRHVDEGYRDLILPFPAIETPAFDMPTLWDCASMLGYIDTWSSVRRHRARTGRDAQSLLSAPLEAAWGNGPRCVRWPLTLKAGRA